MESLNVCQSCHKRAIEVKTSDGKSENLLCKDCSKGFFAGRKLLLCLTCKERVPKDFKYDLSFIQLEGSRKQISHYRVFCSEDCLAKQQSTEKVSLPDDLEPLKSCQTCGKQENKIDIGSMMNNGIPDPKSLQNLLTQSMMSTCARCKKVFYCSRECQTKDWKTHKLECKAPDQETSKTS